MVNNNPNNLVARSGMGPRPAAVEEPQAMSRARRDLLTRLGEYGGACPVDQLARSCGQHPNTVREHLEALVESGHVQRAPAPQPAGRGRPARLYQVAEQATAPAAAATLASVLAAQLAARPDAPAEGIAAGRAWAATLRTGPPEAIPNHRPSVQEVSENIAGALTETGFAAEQSAEDATVLRLTRCPLLDAAREHPDVVCSVHLGLVQGLLDDAGASGTRAQLLPFAASDACLLRLDPPSAS
ncbi:helix-turn-helix transcriptional regulator [Arthrobacter rhombi]|uniref:helix-turn-helix transcriptional regulator n=1 Tax=Micrococcaceae TaxID=1268 RepID=UPI0018EA1A0D|nr:helix-turn-helix domain-containing protein [Glutamicibacter sp. BW78]